MEIERPAQPRARTMPLRGGAAVQNGSNKPKPVSEPPSGKRSKKALRDLPPAKKAPPKKKNNRALRDIPQSKPVQGGGARPTPRNEKGTRVNFNSAGGKQTRPTGPQQRAQARAEINRKINTQTPSRRQQERVVKRVGGSARNIEIKRRNPSGKQRFYVKKKRANLLKLLLARLVLFLVIFALMFSAVSGLFALSLNSGKSVSSKPYTLQLGADKAEDDTSDYKPETMEISAVSGGSEGVTYFPVSALMDYCSLTVTGTVEHLRYVSRDIGGGSMSFVVGSDIAYVNNSKVRMAADSFISGGKLYVPLDFMLRYAQGINIEQDVNADKVTITHVVTDYDAATDTDIYAPLSFGLARTEPLTAIEEPVE